MSCGCGGACCDEGLHGWGLSGITPDAAASQVYTSGTNSGSKAAILASARAGVMLDAAGGPAYIPGTADCKSAGGPQPGGLSLVKTGSSLALTGLQIGLTTSGVISAAALAPFTMGISTLIGLFSVFSAHHAQAVAKEQSVLCSAVPAANNYLQVIDQAVQSGSATPQHGIDALNSLLSDFQSAVSSISHNCNAGCVMTEELHAIVLVKQGEYQDLQAAATAQASVPPPQAAPTPVTAPPVPSSPAVTPARPNVVSSTPTAPTSSSYASFYSGAAPAAPAPSALPSWWPIAAVGLAAFLLVRG